MKDEKFLDEPITIAPDMKTLQILHKRVLRNDPKNKNSDNFEQFKEWEGSILFIDRNNFLEWIGSTFSSFAEFILDSGDRRLPIKVKNRKTF